MEWRPVFINLISFLYFTDCMVGATSITNVTLVDGETPNEGRVEYLVSDATTWESTCGDGLGSQEASVICRQLGFLGVNNFVDRWPFGTSTSIAQHRLNCDGDEDNLAECSLLASSGCSYAGGVICYDTGFLGCYSHPTSALVGLQTPCEYGLEDNHVLTIPKCVSFCIHTNDTYTYAGLYQGNMCLCGKASTTISQADVVDDRFCSSACAGRNIERCGGDSHIALFNISSYLRDTRIQPSLVCKGPPISTTSLPEAPTTFDVPTTVATSHSSTISTSLSTPSAPSSSSSSMFPSSSSPLPSSPSSPSSSTSSPSSYSSSSSFSSISLSSPSSSPSSSLSSPSPATPNPSVIEMIPSTTNQQSSSTSEQVLSSISGSSSSIMTSDGTKSSETALSIALGLTAFLFLCAIVIFYIILRRRISQRYETNVAHMNYSGATDNSFFVSRLSRQDLIPPDLNNGEVNPRESVLMDRTPTDDSMVQYNSSDQFNSRWSALRPRQEHPPLPDPYSRDSTHSESFNMSRSARDSIAGRSPSPFASGTSQQDPMTSGSNGESHGRESLYVNREARDSVYENDDAISDHGDHTYERIILNKIPRNQDQSTV